MTSFISLVSACIHKGLCPNVDEYNWIHRLLRAHEHYDPDAIANANVADMSANATAFAADCAEAKCHTANKARDFAEAIDADSTTSGEQKMAALHY